MQPAEREGVLVMARRPSFRGQDPGHVVLGVALFVTITFLGQAVTDYVIDGFLTAAYMAARAIVLVTAWLVASLLATWLHRSRQ
ncbi:hypothetical protein ACNF49_14845 [Actinomadura sp. ATCC 39365]|uniref:hypothetical protein n=1 Tax=Nonomuraea sp. NPDC005692 TaxID=3157168 RepID=UPI0033D9E8FD